MDLTSRKQQITYPLVNAAGYSKSLHVSAKPECCAYHIQINKLHSQKSGNNAHMWVKMRNSKSTIEHKFSTGVTCHATGCHPAHPGSNTARPIPTLWQ